MAYRMKLHEQAIRFMIRMSSVDVNWPAKRRLIAEFINRNGKTYGRKNTEKAIEEAKKILTLTGSSHG